MGSSRLMKSYFCFRLPQSELLSRLGAFNKANGQGAKFTLIYVSVHDLKLNLANPT